MKALRGLRGQLLLVFALVFGTVTLLAGTYQYSQVGRVLRRSDDQRLRSRAASLLERVETEPHPVVPLPVHGEQMRVVVEEGTGQPARELFHSPGFPAAAVAAETHGLRLVEVQREQLSETGQPQTVRLWLAHSGAPLTADLGRVRQGLWWALAGSLLLAAALAWGLGSWVLRPLRRISRQA